MITILQQSNYKGRLQKETAELELIKNIDLFDLNKDAFSAAELGKFCQKDFTVLLGIIGTITSATFAPNHPAASSVLCFFLSQLLGNAWPFFFLLHFGGAICSTDLYEVRLLCQ